MWNFTSKPSDVIRKQPGAAFIKMVSELHADDDAPHESELTREIVHARIVSSKTETSGPPITRSVIAKLFPME